MTQILAVTQAGAQAGRGQLVSDGRVISCALGPAGIRADKREGDGATPEGRFVLRRVLYRADRLTRPQTGLPVLTLAPDDGWSDDPADRRYNCPVRLPHSHRHERLWRDDQVYDILVVLGHNDVPPTAGQGSAVFFHLAHGDYRPTAGCVAVSLPDMLSLLAGLQPGAVMAISR